MGGWRVAGKHDQLASRGGAERVRGGVGRHKVLEVGRGSMLKRAVGKNKGHELNASR
ncbi:UNVERIFIED_CONTAM: hypothetical protein FKN15_036501 [Acipenser sinensis]